MGRAGERLKPALRGPFAVCGRRRANASRKRRMGDILARVAGSFTLAAAIRQKVASSVIPDRSRGFSRNYLKHQSQL